MTPHSHKPYPDDIDDNYSHGSINNIILLTALLLLSPSLPSVQAQPSLPGESAHTPSNFNPGVGIIVIFIVTALFSIFFLSICFLRCNESGTVGNSIRRIAGASFRGRPRGLDPDVIETFPTFVYSSVKGLKIGKGALECAVCLSEFEDDEKLRLIPKCDHAFHPECIDEWLAAHATCPVCRANLVPQPDESVHLPSGLVVNSDADSRLEVGNSDQNGQTYSIDDNDNNNSIGNTEDSVRGDKGILIGGGGSVGRALNRNRTRGSTRPRRLPRSHSTGHSSAQPGENIERFTLRLPEEVRKQLMDQDPTPSMRVSGGPGSLEGSSVKGYRLGGEGSSQGGRNRRRLDRMVMSDRWVFNRMPSFFQRISSIRSPREPVGGEARAESSHSSRPPV